MVYLNTYDRSQDRRFTSYDQILGAAERGDTLPATTEDEQQESEDSDSDHQEVTL